MNHSVSHLKVFGCVAYAHVPDKLRKKLDKKGHKCIFVDYSEETKAYKLYDVVARKLIISRDVQIVENGSWDRTVENNVRIVSNVEHDDMTEKVVQTPKCNSTSCRTLDSHHTTTYFRRRNVYTSFISSYDDKHTKKIIESI